MNTGRTIRKVLFVAVWVAIGGGMLTLLIAAIGRQKKDHCRDYTISIKGPHNNFFIDDKDVLKLIKETVKGNIKGQPRSSFNLQQMEQALKKNVWVKNAELYFDNHDVLHVSVTEREPIARLFTVTGKSFYLDETENLMPLSDKLSAKVPVFTGFPVKVISRRDSALMHDVKTVAEFILNDPFWMAQVAQIDITPEREFEMIPVVGNHTVILGDGENIDRKFHRLFVFYKNISAKAGFDKYKIINVQYAGQVVGVKDKQWLKADTSQLRLNIEKLLKEARELQNDSLVAAREIKNQKLIPVDPSMSATEKSVPDENVPVENNANPVLVTNPAPMKRFSEPKGTDKSKDDPKPVNDKRVPKAVMPKRSQ